jgi:hypothetical protein
VRCWRRSRGWIFRSALIACCVVGRDAAAGAHAGTGACAARTCHGADAASVGSVRHDEYRIWSTQDPHRNAYRALVGPRGTAIAHRLGLGEGSAWPKSAAGRRACLGCHAVVPDGVAGTPAEDDWLADGVGCEACHGPARGWLRTHTAADRQASLRAGMVETMVPARAAERCVRCHVGTPDLRVDHRLLAAGHPPLVFDLAYFARNQPRHWSVHAGNAGWGTTEALLDGGTVAARARAALAGHGETRRGWPEFAQFDCAACHHDYGRGWEPTATGGAVTGKPPPDGSAAAVRAALGRHEEPAAMARALIAAAPDLAGRGHLTALHAYWAVDALARAAGGDPVAPDLERALTRLECDVRRPVDYDPARFTRHLRALAPLVTSGPHASRGDPR